MYEKRGSDRPERAWLDWRRRLLGVPSGALVLLSVLTWIVATFTREFPKGTTTFEYSMRYGTYTFAQQEGRWLSEWGSSVPERVVSIDVTETYAVWPRNWPDWMKDCNLFPPWETWRFDISNPREVRPAFGAPFSTSEAESLRPVLVKKLRAEVGDDRAERAAVSGLQRRLMWDRLFWYPIQLARLLAVLAMIVGTARAVWPTKAEVHAARRAKGLCPFCEYPILPHGADQPCPECGRSTS